MKKPISLDAQGQPPPQFRNRDNLKKHLEHLLGLCRGVVADRALNEQEVVYLDTWIKDHEDLAGTWIAERLQERMQAVLADGVVDVEEANDLIATIDQLIGGGLEDGIVSGAASFPLAESASVAIPGASFCFTGRFLQHSRNACHQTTRERGGTIVKNVTRSLDYLVIGSLASRDWRYTSHGTKIEKALDLNDRGAGIAIVMEDSWLKAMPDLFDGKQTAR